MRAIPLAGTVAAGRVALIDDEDYDLVSPYKWHLHVVTRGRPCGPYARGSIRLANGIWTNAYMHKLITGWPQTDHENHDGLDNQRHNLRPASDSQNHANMRPRPGGTSRFKGVNWVRHAGRWRASIKVDGRSRHLGYFSDELDAAYAYESAAREAWGQYACTSLTGVASA